MALDRDRARLLELLTQLSFEKRRVTLSSGKESDFYIDCKRTVLTAEGHFLVGRLLWRDIQRLAPTAAAAGASRWMSRHRSRPTRKCPSAVSTVRLQSM